jgi:large subunit ribosomal protein L35
MPKIKTHSGAAKRFKVTGTGKLKKTNAFKQHILSKKSTKRKRNMRGTELVNAADVKAVRKMLPGL